LQESLVLVHGGMAQNVGPILEMATEKYLLRSEPEWTARQRAVATLDEILALLAAGDVRGLGRALTHNFFGPLQTIIPWVSNRYTESIIARTREAFGDDFWGFWMLGGMSGGGMGFIFAPERKAQAQTRLQELMSQAKRELQTALPFAMEPVVYDFAINERGTWADCLAGPEALLPKDYYALHVPRWLRADLQSLPLLRRAELDKFGAACRTRPELSGMVQALFDRLLPRLKSDGDQQQTLAELLAQGGFDRVQHEQIRTDLKHGRIGLAQNRLPISADIRDVAEGDVVDAMGVCGIAGAGIVSGAGAPPVIVRQAPRLPSPLPFTSFDPESPAAITHRRLPHWTQQGCTYFVTFRLADALPITFWERWRRERDEALQALPGNATQEQREQALALFTAQLEAEADQGHGACVLREATVADELEAVLRHFDGQQYQLGSYVIMPNHVHAIVRPLEGHSLSRILQDWKSISAHKLNRRLGRKGDLWQEESFDHIIRDEHQLERFERYVAQNPEKAQLKVGGYRLGIGTCGHAAEPAGGAPAGLWQAGAPALLPGASLRERGLAALRNGELAVVTLAAGVGSRWTQGAGVVKGLHPFAKLGGQHRTFIETHLAKSRRIGRLAGTPLPHLITTSWLTHAAIEEFLLRHANHGYPGPLCLSPGRAIGLRMIPMERDLRFLWEEMPQQVLDEQQQKVRDSLHQALRGWARSAGEGKDYTDNLPVQCLHPVGHWYEVPNLLRNGVLARLLAERPQLKHLLLHNVDTLGADADPAMFGLHVAGGACLTFEVITRRLEDRGGGLARVNGQVRLVEGLALPREEDEFNLRYYNSNTCWIDLDQLLQVLGLTRDDILRGATSGTAGEAAHEKIAAAVRTLAARVPTYITIKEVKKRWGHGQEDVFPVTQWEKLWVDMTSLPEVSTQFAVVPRLRGQQLKDQAQLDGWLRDGSAAHVESLCEWA
jgi:REP element-mobilizing transposase RayT